MNLQARAEELVLIPRVKYEKLLLQQSSANKDDINQIQHDKPEEYRGGQSYRNGNDLQKDVDNDGGEKMQFNRKRHSLVSTFEVKKEKALSDMNSGKVDDRRLSSFTRHHCWIRY